MNSRIRVSALSILACAALAAIPARAETFSTGRFDITFQDGWESLTPANAGDSVLAVMSTFSMMGFCTMSATSTDHPVTAAELEEAFKAYGGGDSVTKVTEGTATLGGKAFTFVEYKSVDSSNGDLRIRQYYTTSGSILFSAMLVFDNGASTNPVEQVETALGTLSLKGTPIRAWSARDRSLNPARLDVLGRSRPQSARTALFRLPLR